MFTRSKPERMDRNRQSEKSRRTLPFVVRSLEIIGKLFLIVTVIFLAVVFLSPNASFKMGNLFFGDIPQLYHVQTAHFLFKRAAYPVFRQTPAPYAHYQLSRINFIQGELYSALDEAKAELERYPEHTGTYYVLGLTLGYLNRNHEAIDAFSRYIETHPGTWAGRNDKAWLQFRVGDIAGAMETIEPIAENFRRTPWVQNTYCALLINQNRLAEAEIACDNAREVAMQMDGADWGYAYPGNDPAIYDTGLEMLRRSIDENLRLLANKKRETDA